MGTPLTVRIEKRCVIVLIEIEMEMRAEAEVEVEILGILDR